MKQGSHGYMIHITMGKQIHKLQRN